MADEAYKTWQGIIITFITVQMMTIVAEEGGFNCKEAVVASEVAVVLEAILGGNFGGSFRGDRGGRARRGRQGGYMGRPTRV